MTPALVLLSLSPVAGLLACMLLHVVLSRSAPRLPRPHAIGLSALGGFVVVGGMPLLAGATPMSSSAHALEFTAVWLVTYLLLTYCYAIGFFNLGESARRIRLLIELHGAGDRGMTVDEILAVYNARMIVEARLSRLVAGGQIVERGARYFIKGRLMLYSAKGLALLKLVLLPEKGGLGGRGGPSGTSGA